LICSLEHINAHFDHFRNQIRRIGITVVDDYFHSVTLPVAVDLFVGLQKKIVKHGRRHERRNLGTPVDVVKKRIGL
jgi:hypothetical protein